MPALTVQTAIDSVQLLYNWLIEHHPFDHISRTETSCTLLFNGRQSSITVRIAEAGKVQMRCIVPVFAANRFNLESNYLVFWQTDAVAATRCCVTTVAHDRGVARLGLYALELLRLFCKGSP
jgi:hypothetical protein